jgi:hypothetical protein
VTLVLATGAVAGACGLFGLWFVRQRRAMVPVR